MKQMDKCAIILRELSAEELISLFDKLQVQLDEIKKGFQPKEPTEYLTRNETADLLKCDLSTLWIWHKKGKLVPHGIANRVYYKRSDIEAVMKPLGKKKGVNNG